MKKNNNKRDKKENNDRMKEYTIQHCIGTEIVLWDWGNDPILRKTRYRVFIVRSDWPHLTYLYDQNFTSRKKAFTVMRELDEIHWPKWSREEDKEWIDKLTTRGLIV
jgi:hypothetical protein